MSKPRVLMIGPGRDVMGGIATVINNYYAGGLDDDIDLYYLPTMENGNKVKKILVAAKAYIAFGALLKRYNIVHIHMAAQASFDRKALFVKRANKAGKKIIIHQHAADFDKYFFEQVSAAKKQKIIDIFNLADRVIVLSEEWADFFGKNICDSEKIEIIYNGVSVPDYIKKDYSDHNVLMLGQLGKRKGTYDLLQAIPLVLKAIPDARFYLGGDGEIDRCKKIVSEFNLSEHVHILGWIRDQKKKELFEECSTFILPSYKEGMPMAVLEAMSYGLATISTNAGGIPRIIEQKKNGIRVEAGDVEAIASALVDVLQDDKKRQSLGIAGRERIKQRFDFKANIDRLKNVYATL